MFRLKISKTVNNNYILCQTKLKYKTFYTCKSRFSWVSNDFKLLNNLIRAKTSIFNILNYNKFKFFYTQTINSIYARNDLKLLINKFSNITRQLRKDFPNLTFYYLLVPEYHADSTNWHLHGFLSEGYEVLLYDNKNGYNSLSRLDKIGYNSVSIIKNYEACCKYALKYITKDSLKNIKKGERLYYCSNGLIRDCVVNDLVLSNIAPIHFDFKNEYVFKATLNENKYYNFITGIDNIKRLNYYNYEVK